MAKRGGTMQSYFYCDKGEDVLVEEPARPAMNGRPNSLSADGPKLSGYVGPPSSPSDCTATARDCKYLAQMGVTHCFTWYATFQDVSRSSLALLQRAAEENGLILNNVGVLALGKSKNIILASAERDRDIEHFATFIGWLGELGVAATTFTWEAEGVVYSTGKARVRGACTSRYVDASLLVQRRTERAAEEEHNQEQEQEEDREGRDEAPCLEEGIKGPTEEELWDNMAYFLDRIIPCCEKSNVRLLLHPNDPPLPCVNGIPNLMRSSAAFERVYALANQSPAIGMEFCCGTWLEGCAVDDPFCRDAPPAHKGQFGPQIASLYDALAHFITQSRVGIVHLRNTTAPLPRFAETFIDDGCLDICEVARVLVQTGYTGMVILDHTPRFDAVEHGGDLAATSFTLGYIKACIRSAQTFLQSKTKEKM